VAETSYGWRFQPQNTTPETGLVIYPGGHVDPRSYAPLARDLAARGHVVAVLKVPLSLAVLAPRAADAPLHQERSVATWVLAGHSLGGVMAARYARSYPDSISGLLLLASYPDAAADLSTSTIPATSIVGTADGVLNTTAWDAARPRLPRDTKIVEIPGGNHSQFGSYGLQGGDNVATISADLQERAIADAAQELFVRAAAYRVP
jgi:pimeloyl-ACP methyl ester carboxylesterase